MFNNYLASVFTSDNVATPSVNPQVGTQNTFINSVEFTPDCSVSFYQ